MRTLAATTATILLSFSLPSALAAEDGSQANSAYLEGDYASALRQWLAFAEQGDADAQTQLGIMYSNGEGVPQNFTAAVRWYRMAAEQASPFAQYNLGFMYYDGRGVPQNYQLAYMWFNLAAAQGKSFDKGARELAADHMTSEGISRAQQLSQDCFQRNYQGC
jgi:TPR repeat protein